MLYTVVPIDFVFSNRFKESPGAEAYSIGSGIVETRRTAQGREVTRVISTNLKDYLNPKYGLGKILF